MINFLLLEACIFQTCWATEDYFSASLSSCKDMHARANNKEQGRCTSRDHTSWSKQALIKWLHGLLLVIEPKASVCEAMDQKVTVISRLEWGAATPRNKETLRGSAQRVVIHHTALANYKDQRECMDHLVSIQRMHMKERAFDDIGYNFLVGGDGTVYEGRGWGVVGAHTKGNNHDSLGIAFMGNFNNDTPSKEAISSVKQLLQSGVSQGFIHPQFVLFGHRDLGNTECPGQKLYDALPQLRSTT